MRIFDADVTGSLQVSGSSNFKGGVTVSGSQTITGSLTVHGNAKLGDQLTDTHTVTGSLLVTGSISGSLTGALRTDYIDFNTGSTIAGAIGRMTWNDTDGTVDLGLKGGNVTLQVGQEQLVRVVNRTGGNLLESNYHVVRVDGAQGNRLKIALAQANNDDNSAETLGLVTENINNGSEGFVTVGGLVRQINTTGALFGELWNDGDTLYLSPTNAGRPTNIKPEAPNHLVIVGYVVRAHATQGAIFVKVNNGYEIDELHNVKINTGSLSYGDLLMRSGSIWTNSKALSGSYQLTGSLDISGSQTINGNQIISGSITITQNISVLGTSSFVYVTSSNLNLTGPFIYTNVFEPVERFGGLVVFDSGSNSHLATASLLWDSTNNHWIYQNASGSMYSGGMLLSGPRNTGSLGDELGLTSTRIPKSVGGDHLDNSNIYDDGSKVKIISNTEITGSLKVTGGISGSIDYSYIQNVPSLVSGSAQINITGTTGYSSVSSSIATALNGAWRASDGITSEDISFNETVIIQGGANTNVTFLPGVNTFTINSSHQSVSAASSSNNSGRTYIQDILVDGFGHITGITTASETVVNTDIYTTGVTFNTGDGVLTFNRNDGNTYTVDLDGRYGTSSTDFYTTGATFNTSDGVVTFNRNDGGTYTVDLDGRFLTAHPSVSAASSSNNSGRTYIQDILLDSFGHITGITTATETVVDTYTTGGTINSSTGLITFTKSDGGTYTTNISGYVTTQIANLVDSAPTTLDTLKELATALGNDPNFATTIATSIGNKVSKSGDTMTGNLTAPKFITSGGTSSQFVKGDGTLDSSTYLTSFSETDTLATVTARGSSTATPVTFNSNVTLGNSADLVFSDLAGTFPTSGKGFDWTLNNDGARIYAIQPSSDSIDLVFQLRDNATTNDRFVFWVDDYQGPAFDKYPLIIRGGTEFDLVNSSLYIGGTLVISNGRVLQNVTGNISMFTNDSGYLTAHPSVTAASSSNNSGRTYIQDILLDSFGHITGITTATETVTDTNDFITNVSLLGNTLRFTSTGGAFSGDIDLTPFTVDNNTYVTGGTFNTGTGNLRLTRNDGNTIDVSLDGRYLTAHPSVSAASSSNNSGRTYIQDILLDSFGHITGITTGTETVVDTDINYYTTGATFNTSNGVVTFNRNDGGTYTVDIDGRFLTGYTETSTLEDVVQRGDTTTISITAASFITQGGNSGQFVKGDGSLDSNTYLTAHPSVSAASSSNNSGRTYIQDILLDSFGHITGITTASETVTDTNYYVTSASFNTGTGVITLTRNDGGTVTVDIDGKYAESSHTHSIDSITDEHRLFNNMGDNHSTQTDFNAITNFGARFVQGTTNGPGTGSSQFYGFTLGLGNEYAIDQYALQLALPRYGSSDKYISIRTKEASSWGSWYKIHAGYADTAGNADTLDGQHGSYYYAASNPSGYISSYLNYYTTGATFNTGNGVITFSRNDGNTYTVDIDGKYAESSHTHDDRYLPYVKNVETSGLVSGRWYTIAVNVGNRAVGKFILRDTSSGNHQSVVFYATHHYGNYSDITVLINSRYSGNPFRYLRIVDGTTYDGALLQVYIDQDNSTVQAWMLENIQASGWVIKDWVDETVDPGDVTNFPALTTTPAQVDLDQAPQGGMIVTGPIYGGGDTTQYEYLNTNNYSTTTDTRYYTETEIANFFSGASAITGYNKSNWDTAYGWGNHATQGYATTGYVQTQITNLIDGAPSALDTLNELAAALGDDANFATTIATSIGAKLPLSGGTMTGNIAFGATSNLGLTWGLNTDAAFIKFISTSNSAGGSYLEIGTQDDSDEEIKFTQSGNVRFYLATDGFLKNGSGYKYVFENGTWGINISGNAATVTNGVYTNGSYSNPSWITALAGSKITGNISGNASNITSYTINQDLGTSNSVSFNAVASPVYYTTTSSTRNKIRLWGSDANYTIGMESAVVYGGLNDYAMTFQFNNDADRGFWWGHADHNTAQGAMALTTNGYLTVARGVRVGYGESDTTTPNVPLQVYGSGSLVFDVQGSQGQLFSVTDSLSGSLYSVNDISGLPILEVFSDDRVVMGSYGLNSFVVSGTTTTVSGSLAVSGSATVNGGTVWHSNNDGSGSGLDADTLDGYHASSFLTSYSETDTLSSVTARGNTTTTHIGVTTSSPINFAASGNLGTWIGGIQDATAGWSITNNGIGLKADNNTYAGMVLAGGNGLLYFGRTNASGVGTMSSWLEVNSSGTANFKLSRPQHNGSNLALVSEIPTNLNQLTNGPGYITAHPSVSAASSVNNSGRTYIQDILLDSFGHITGITSATETVTDTNDFISDVNFDGTNLTFTGSGGAFSGPVDISSVNTDTNYYTTSASFNTSNGIITFSRNDGGTYTVDIDGKYAEASSLSSYLPLAGGTMTGTITITNTDIRSNATSNWTGDPGTQGKIQYHSNRWYIVSDSSSNRIVQFRRDSVDVSYIDNNGVFQGQATNVSINYNNDSNSTYQMLWGSGNAVYGTGGVYLNPSTDYVYASSFVASDWFRSTGNTGWINTTHGGGWFMSDSTWIRNYNSKQVYIDSLLEVGSSGIQNAGNYRILNSASNGWTNVIERNSGTPLFYGSVYYDFDNTAYYLNPASTSNLATVKLNSTASGTEVFTVDGVNGRLFTITDDLSDSLFSVNTIAGVPVIEAFSDYRVIMGRYNQNDFYIATTGEIGMGNTSVSGYKLAVTGNVRATSFVKTGGSSSQFLMADGSVSTNPGWLTVHPSVSAAGSSNNSGRTYIQDILLDSFGHITGITTATETVVDTDTNYYTTSASFNTGDGVITFTRNDGGTYTVDIDGRFLTSYTETDTFATVTARGNISNGAVTINGALTVGQGTSSDIYMTDTDETTRRIHCNSSRIGFLNSSSNWGAYNDNTGNWRTDFAMYSSDWFRSVGSTGWYSETYAGGIYMEDSTWVRVYNNKRLLVENIIQSNTAVYAPIFYDSGNGAYYLNPNGYSNLGTVRFNSSGAGAEVIAADGVNGRLFTITDDMTDSIFSVNTISGLPVIEAFADYKVVMGRYGQNDLHIDNAGLIGIGKVPSTYKVDINGNVMVRGGYAYYGEYGTWTGEANKIQWHSNNLYIQNTGGGEWLFRNSAGSNVVSIANGGTLTAAALVKSGGTSAQFLMADGSVSTNPGWITSYVDTDTNYYVTGATFNTSNGVITMTRNDGGTITVDIDGKYAESSHTHDDRYFTETESDARFQPLENQRLSTGNSPTFSQVFTTQIGINDSGIDCYMEVGDGNPTEDGIAYGGTFHFYGDKTLTASHLYFGGALIYNNLVVNGRITENSSIRYKKDIQQIENGLEKVLQLSGVTYTKINNEQKEAGVIAEEVAKILPEAVGFDTEGRPDSVSYGRLTALLIEAIKDLKKEIDELKGNK